MNDEMTSMCGVSLIIAVLEHLGQKDPVIIQNIPNINFMYMKEMEKALTPDYKNMLI